MRTIGSVCVLLAALSAPGAGAQASQGSLATATVSYVTIARERLFDGVIEAVQRSTVSAETSGRIVELNFDVDDYVEKGQVILRFRDKEQRARLDSAQASLQEAEARLAQARKEHERIERLYDRDLVSKSAMDKATAELRAADARFDAAQAKLEEAREQLSNTVVRAPYSGIVVERHVELGEAANVGTPLMTGLSLEHLRALVHLPQSFVHRVRDSREAHVLIPPDGERMEAEKIVVYPYADVSSHTFKVRAELPQGATGLYPGMLVKVAFKVGEAQRLMVPAAAVVNRSEVTGVYVIAPDGEVSLRQVRVGRARADQIEVLAGLEKGEQVALDPIAAGVLLKQKRAGAKAAP